MQIEKPHLGIPDSEFRTMFCEAVRHKVFAGGRRLVNMSKAKTKDMSWNYVEPL